MDNEGRTKRKFKGFKVQKVQGEKGYEKRRSNQQIKSQVNHQTDIRQQTTN
jgi:hypothetical protein